MGTEAGYREADDLLAPVLTVNAAGTSPFVLVCDHASNRIPAAFDGLGLRPHERFMHVAWDPGALAVALRLTELLDAPLVYSTVSRLVVDCNRAEDAPDIMPVLSERVEIAGNRGIDAGERLRRIARYHAPFHAAIDALLEARGPRETILVTVHSFTPTYHGQKRPWPIGLIHGADERFSRAFAAALLAEDPDLRLGWNEPYSGRNGVTYTLEHHGDGRGLDATMIEIRHDEILEPAGVAFWAERLARTLAEARRSTPHEGPLGAVTQSVSASGGLNG